MTFTDERDESSQLLSPFHPKFKNMQNIKHNNNYNYTLVTNGSGRGILGVPIDSDSAITTTDNTQSTSTTTTVSSTTPLLPKPDADTRMGRIARRIPALGIIMAFMSVLCYSLGSAIVNLMPELHSLEILMIRSIFQFVTFGTLVIIKGYSIAPAEGHKSTLALRIISGTITLTTVFVAYRLMPLADASTIQFSSPVFVAIFAYFMLRESINCIQGVAGLVTLAGVVVIAQPEFIFGAQSSLVYDQRLLGTTLAVVSSISGAFSMITLRKLKTTPVPVIVTWYGLAVSIVGLIILLALNELTLPQGWYTWGLLWGVGICGIGDQFFVSKAMQYESAGPVSVTRTLTVVMTFVWEAVILNKTIEWLSIVGATIITSCILLIALDKWRHESPETFQKLSCNCCQFSVSDDYYDGEEGAGKPFSPDRYASYYDSVETYRRNKQLYYNQFEVAIDGNPSGPNVFNK